MPDLQFGFTIPQIWVSDLPTETEPVKQYQFAKRICKIADTLGYHSAYAYDHFIPNLTEDASRNYFECYMLLSAIAANTSKLRVGQSVTCNSFRNPALLAKMLSTFDVITNGRVELGIGAGWYDQEYRQYGYTYPSDITRIRQLDESLNIIKALWTENVATFAGQYFSIKNCICNPKPVQKPYPTIMVGGKGERYLLKIAAKHANRYNYSFGLPEDLKKKISALKEHCIAVSRDHREIELSVLVWCLIKDTDEEVIAEISRRKNKEMSIAQFVHNIGGNHTIGTPEHILQGLCKYVDLGIRHFILHFIGLDEDTIRLFDSKVIRKL